ncbi:hypothetical protein PCASD_18135 [Puccinia coronata f. sp. avenae]|uniref:Uncharacterized protein n=1 Tax=Puccinia coronata f. sp. avenae TaxID=200324 RepID=A0A2N5SVC4_9BASI|nr:hypothetical protein PCASD_18135 [Puccinia coronata f. sp. avenae]
MEYINNATFDENSESQDSWLAPSPGATKFIPFLDSQPQGSPLQESQVIARSAADLLGAFPLIIQTRNVASPNQNAPPQPFVTGNAADPKQQAPPYPLQLEMASLAAAGIPDSQQSRIYTQPGVKRTIHLDYVLYSRLVIDNLIRTTWPSSSLSKKEAKKEWEKYSPSGDLRVWEEDLSMYNFEKFKTNVVDNLGKGQALFCKLLDTLIPSGDIKWQAIISNSRIYGPKKLAFLNFNQDFYEFVKAAYKAPNSKVTIKLVMDNPQGKAKQLEHERSLEDNLTLAFGPDKEQARLE